MITIKEVGVTPTQYVLKIVAGVEEFKKDMMQLAEDTHDFMIGVIRENKHRKDSSTGRLESSIQVEKTATGFGIGNIDYMDQFASHWYKINHGGMVAPKAQKVPGYFTGTGAPDPQFRGGNVGGIDSFVYVPRGSNMNGGGIPWGMGKQGRVGMMFVKRPIPAMNYIEKTKSWLTTQASDRLVLRTNLTNASFSASSASV